MVSSGGRAPKTPGLSNSMEAAARVSDMRSLVVKKQQNGETGKSKPSSQFQDRLILLEPNESVRAIVLLETSKPRAATVRPNRQERQIAINATRNSASAALTEIDRILAQFKGKRLSSRPTALGTIAVESVGAGIVALAASDRVKAISEDLPVSLAR